MTSYIGAFVVGVICTVLGVLNMRGNISSLHSYHRHRVSEEDRIPFGRLVGLGTVISGGALCVFGALSAVATVTEVQAFRLAGSVLLIIGVIAGLGISFYAMIKYNKGIF